MAHAEWPDSLLAVPPHRDSSCWKAPAVSPGPLVTEVLLFAVCQKDRIWQQGSEATTEKHTSGHANVPFAPFQRRFSTTSAQLQHSFSAASCLAATHFMQQSYTIIIIIQIINIKQLIIRTVITADWRSPPESCPVAPGPDVGTCARSTAKLQLESWNWGGNDGATRKERNL